MTITLNIQPEIEKGLLARATARGVSLTDYVNEIVIRQEQSASESMGKRTGRELLVRSIRQNTRIAHR